jgi:hypothetical protein
MNYSASQFLLSFEQPIAEAAIRARQEADAAAWAKAKARIAKREENARQKRTAKLVAAQRRQEREAAKAKEQSEKEWRRTKRGMEQRKRQPDEHASCGIRWFCRSPRDRERGTYWKTCPDCGRPLEYTSDHNAKGRECTKTLRYTPNN